MGISTFLEAVAVAVVVVVVVVVVEGGLGMERVVEGPGKRRGRWTRLARRYLGGPAKMFCCCCTTLYNAGHSFSYYTDELYGKKFGLIWAGK